MAQGENQREARGDAQGGDARSAPGAQLVQVMQRLLAAGLNQGMSGNASVRHDPLTGAPALQGFWITPTALAVERMQAQDMVFMDLEGGVHATDPRAADLQVADPRAAGKPSSEWRFHRDILRARPEVGAIIHTHSPFATTLACAHRSIPAFHYMIAQLGGEDIRCAPYALFGTQALSDAALQALEGRQACLLANHGMIALGRNLDQALAHALALESLSEQYWRVLQIGPAQVLDPAQMAQVQEQFKGYGR